MSEQNSKADENATQHSAEVKRGGTPIDTEHRGVTGTLVLTDVLDEKVPLIPNCTINSSMQIFRILNVLRQANFLSSRRLLMGLF
jgi:hypothetical protein